MMLVNIFNSYLIWILSAKTEEFYVNPEWTVRDIDIFLYV